MTDHCLSIFFRAFIGTSVAIGAMFLLAWGVGRFLKYAGRAELYPPTPPRDGDR